MYSFEWDEDKNTINQNKHGVSFVLLVVHCIRDNDVIRIISSRKATKTETKNYEEKTTMKKNDKTDEECLEKEFDFNKAVKNPYASKLKKQITIKLSPAVIDYFKDEAEETGIPYQTLINLYLTDCMKEKRKLKINWG